MSNVVLVPIGDPYELKRGAKCQCVELNFELGRVITIKSVRMGRVYFTEDKAVSVPGPRIADRVDDRLSEDNWMTVEELQSQYARRTRPVRLKT
ncbi:MAG: hypothetical protein HF312_17175 [Ignavibacteria bacterium]|jgi:hypothetical protein|nr:hypothetical protein [Ignavibacteria bacterium]